MSHVSHISTLFLLIICCILSCQAEKLDCTRMVFHPRCRGISAKRSSSIPLFEDTEKQYTSDESLESTNWKSEIDDDLLERMVRDMLFGNMKLKSHGHTYMDDDK